MLIKPLERAQLNLLAQALTAEKLPTADLTLANREFFRLVDDAGHDVAFGGWEMYGRDALLRSIVVPQKTRGGGVGREMVLALIDQARARGVTRLWLLTTTAAAFFAKMGFRQVDRATVPVAIAATAEFADLCPASAVCMSRDI